MTEPLKFKPHKAPSAWSLNEENRAEIADAYRVTAELARKFHMEKTARLHDEMAANIEKGDIK